MPRGKALAHGEEGSLRIREEKALEFNNFFSRFTKENGKYIFSFFTKPCLGLPRSARAYNPLVRREGRLGLGFPKKNFKVPARVCVTCPEMPGSARGSDALGEERSGPRRGGREGRLGLGFPKKKFFKVPARVCVTCPGMPGSARGSDALGGRGAWDLGPLKNFQSPSSRGQPCPGMPGSVRGSDALGGTLRSMARREGPRGTRPEACQFGQEPVSENPRQTRLLLPESSPRPKGTRARFYSPDGEDRPLWGPLRDAATTRKMVGRAPTPGPTNSDSHT